MRQKIITLVGIMIIIVAGAAVVILVNNKDNNASKEQDNSIKVVTSFYPTYIIGLNITDGIEGIVIDNLTDNTIGCLHDYQLTTKDMKKLANADVFIMNGGGMESYLDEVIANFPSLKIINISDGIDMLEDEAHEHAHDEDNHEGHEHIVNAHVWLDPKLYMQQIENAAEGFAGYIETLSLNNTSMIITQINKNKDEYLSKVAEIDEEFEESLGNIKTINLQGKDSQYKAIIFHDAFSYLAEMISLEVTYTVDISGDTALSAGEIAEVIDMVKEDGVKYLFVEKQYGTSIADRISEETDAKVYVIDSAVTGDSSKDSYLKSMRMNLGTLEGAFE